jgi:Flp pilus assembly protein TadG
MTQGTSRGAKLLERLKNCVKSGLLREDGATLMEMAVSLVVLITALFCIIQVCFALYAYNAVTEAAREATRYAAVRGSQSCGILSTFPNCNLGPTTTGNPIQTYIQGLGYPISNGMTVSATWWAASVNSATGSTVWTTACTTLVDSNNNACNQSGNQVKVVVSYSLSMPIPFVTSSATVMNVHSTSQMVIFE